MGKEVELKVVKGTVATTISSREVAEMLEVKEHSKMLRKIDSINEILTKAKCGLSDYWYESSYKDSTGRALREYQVTKKGCELLAHKTEGEKGVLFTIKYMERFEELSNMVKDSYLIENPIDRAKRWIQEQEEKQQLIEMVQQQQPKIEYHDTVLNKAELLPVNVIAKDMSMSAVKLNKIMHNQGIIYKKGSTWYPYANFEWLIDKGYADYKSYKQEGAKPQLQWTEKGRQWIIDNIGSWTGSKVA